MTGLAETGIGGQGHPITPGVILNVGAVAGLTGNPAMGVGTLTGIKSGGVATQAGTVRKVTRTGTGKLKRRFHQYQSVGMGRIVPIL
jgi:hypothetical protein